MNILLRKNSPEHLIRLSHQVIQKTETLLSKKNITWLLHTPDIIKFDYDEPRSYFHPSSNTIVMAFNDEATMGTDLLHELGHVLMEKQGLLAKFRIFWAHITADKDWHTTQYSKKSNKEMFAEMFVHYVLNALTPIQEKWMANFLKIAKN